MPPTKSVTVSRQTPRQKDLASSKTQQKRLREELRQEVCVAPAYPGKPEQYRYVAQHCVKIGVPGSSAGTAATTARPKASISPADTKKEIRLLQKAIEGYGKDYDDFQIDGTNITAMLVVFDMMLLTNTRKRFPDPVKRYDYCVERIQKISPEHEQVSVPRFTVFRMVMIALKSK